MADAVAVGEIFSSPTAKSFYDSIRAVDQGMGVAVLYGNYAGDNMNVKMAMELAEDDDIEVRTVVANDDVASAPKEDITKRRGVAERKRHRELIWMRSSLPHKRQSRIQEAWVSDWDRVQYRQTESRTSRSSRERWSLESDITESRAYV